MVPVEENGQQIHDCVEAIQELQLRAAEQEKDWTGPITVLLEQVGHLSKQLMH